LSAWALRDNLPKESEAKMSNTWVFICIIGLSMQSWGGPSTSGGGKSIVCRDGNNRIKSVELLDLYEGRVQYQLNYQEAPESWQDQIKQQLHRTKLDEYYNSLEIGIPLPDRVADIIAAMTVIPPGTKLNPINDSLEVIAPVGCGIEQTANYQTDLSVLIDGEIWNAMSNMQKAALIMHEAIYRGLRSHGEADSRRARHFNAYIFSGGDVNDGISLPTDTKIVDCRPVGEMAYYSNWFVLFLTDDPKAHVQNLGVQFLSLGGHAVLTKKTLLISSADANGSHGMDPRLFLQELVSPSAPYNGDIYGISVSSFEPGDNVSISVFRSDENSPMKVLIHGTSSFDGSVFEKEMSCGWNTVQNSGLSIQ